MTETFWTLLRDSAHWEFEIFLTILTELATAGIGWLFVRKHWRHHLVRDERDTIYNWSMSPTAKAAGHQKEFFRPGKVMETPEGICEGCGGVQKPLDGVDICLGCGAITVQKQICAAGVPMSRNGVTHCIDDSGHGSVGAPCNARSRYEETRQ